MLELHLGDDAAQVLTVCTCYRATTLTHCVVERATHPTQVVHVGIAFNTHVLSGEVRKPTCHDVRRISGDTTTLRSGIARLVTHVERNVECLHRIERTGAAQIELQHASVAIGGVAHTKLVGAIGNRRQTECKVVGTHAEDFISLIVCPSAVLTTQVIHLGIVTVVDHDVAVVVLRHTHVTSTGKRVVDTTDNGFHL